MSTNSKAVSLSELEEKAERFDRLVEHLQFRFATWRDVWQAKTEKRSNIAAYAEGQMHGYAVVLAFMGNGVPCPCPNCGGARQCEKTGETHE